MEDGFEGVGLNLGCGRVRWPSPWINVDLTQGDLQTDIRTLSGVPADSIQQVAAIHVIEHFYQWEVADILLQWKRVLKPGGKLILELPCMYKVITYLHDCLKKGREISPTMSWHVFWGDPRYKDDLMVHKWGYTTEMMKAVIAETGFEQVSLCEPRYHFPFRDMRVEAIKPC